MSFSDCLTKIEDKSKEKINWKKKIRDKRNVTLKIIDTWKLKTVKKFGTDDFVADFPS